ELKITNLRSCIGEHRHEIIEGISVGGAINIGSADLSSQNGPLPVVRAGDYKLFVSVEFNDGTILEDEGTICVYQICQQGNQSESLPENCTFPDQFDPTTGQNTLPTSEVDCQ
ncbi:MAG: hypothetical protein AAFQ87_17130, partial [Bacteroidota bacterium]